MVSPLSFVDYREWLRAFYHWKNESEGKYTYAQFAQDINFPDRSFLHGVIAGRRHLPKNRIDDLIIGLGLSATDGAYIKLIHGWICSNSADERNQLWKQIQQSYRQQIFQTIDEDDFCLLDHWYILPLKEIAIRLNTIDAEVLAQNIQPQITVNQAQSAIGKLLDRGLICCQENQVVELRASIQIGGEQSPSHRKENIRHLQKDYLDVAKLALDQIPSQDRLILNQLLTMPLNKITELESKIRELQSFLIQAAQEPMDDGAGVFQFSIQLIPFYKESSK